MKRTLTVADVRVVHRDADLLVVSKPPGLPTTAPDGDPRCLAAYVRQLDDSTFLHPTSRLDLPVSGLVTFARSKRANEALLEARRRGTYARLYLGLTHASLSPSFESHWTEDLALDPSNPRRRIVATKGAHAQGRRDANTRASAAGVADHGALLHLRPMTGRTHQLRVHAAHHGVPLLGDTRYGGLARATLPNGRVLAARRVMLHCAALDLPSVEGQPLSLRDPAPDDFARIWRGLGGDSSALELPSLINPIANHA